MLLPKVRTESLRTAPAPLAVLTRKRGRRLPRMDSDKGAAAAKGSFFVEEVARTSRGKTQLEEKAGHEERRFPESILAFYFSQGKFPGLFPFWLFRFPLFNIRRAISGSSLATVQAGTVCWDPQLLWQLAEFGQGQTSAERRARRCRGP